MEAFGTPRTNLVLGILGSLNFLRFLVLLGLQGFHVEQYVGGLACFLLPHMIPHVLQQQVSYITYIYDIHFQYDLPVDILIV